MSAYVSTSSTLDHALQPLGPPGSVQLRLSRQAATRFAQLEAAAARRAAQSRLSGSDSLWRRARGLLSRPRPA
jgi:hypothetical protein